MSPIRQDVEHAPKIVFSSQADSGLNHETAIWQDRGMS